MRTQYRIAVICLIFMVLSSLLAACGNNDQLESLPKTMAALTQKAMFLPAVTYTPIPTETATLTPIPSETPTITITPTPDFTNFLNVTPASAQVNTAVFKGVNFKFVKSEISETSKPMDPNSTTGKETSYAKGKKTANVYFMTDSSEMYKKVIGDKTYISVTFSDGVKETVYEGWEKNGGALKSYYASEKKDTVGEVDFIFGIPKDSLTVVEVKIAESVETKDKAVVLYKK